MYLALNDFFLPLYPKLSIFAAIFLATNQSVNFCLISSSHTILINGDEFNFGIPRLYKDGQTFCKKLVLLVYLGHIAQYFESGDCLVWACFLVALMLVFVFV